MDEFNESGFIAAIEDGNGEKVMDMRKIKTIYPTMCYKHM